MNQQTQTTTDSQSKLIRRTCPKCGYIRETVETNCADCRKVLQSVSTIRILGVVLVILGSSLLGIMGWLTLWIYGAMSPHGNQHGSRFNGDSGDALFIVFVFGLVTAIGLSVTAGGFWQIVFGKRNKLIVIAVAGLTIVFLVTGLAVRTMK